MPQWSQSLPRVVSPPPPKGVALNAKPALCLPLPTLLGFITVTEVPAWHLAQSGSVACLERKVRPTLQPDGQPSLWDTRSVGFAVTILPT